MTLRARNFFVRLLLGTGVAAATILTTTAAGQQQEQRQGSLELRKVRHVIDGDGKFLLSLQFANLGAKAVTVTAIAPSRFGPWSDVGRSVEAGTTFKTLMKTGKDEPRKVWIDTSEGFCVFQLPAQN